MGAFAALSSAYNFMDFSTVYEAGMTHNTLSRDSGVAAIESLMERSGTFDYILLETSGLAEPGNIAPLFWVDDGLGSSIYLDGIVTLVDAKNILQTLNETSAPHTTDGIDNTPALTTAHLQISHADVVVVNKSDLVTVAELSAVIQRVKAINGLAKIHVTQQSKVPELEGFLLDIHAYDALGTFDTVDKGHSHLDPVLLVSLNCGTSHADYLVVHLNNFNRSPYPVSESSGCRGRMVKTYSLGCCPSKRAYLLLYPRSCYLLRNPSSERPPTV